MARTSIPDKKLAKALDRVHRAQDRVLRLYPGDSGARQAVHTVYGGAHLFTADTARKLGELAKRALDTYAPDADTFAEAIGLRGDLAHKVYERVREKLPREAVEDFRIDFEDGYGNRPDDEEDGHAVAAARRSRPRSRRRRCRRSWAFASSRSTASSRRARCARSTCS